MLSVTQSHQINNSNVVSCLIENHGMQNNPVTAKVVDKNPLQTVLEISMPHNINIGDNIQVKFLGDDHLQPLKGFVFSLEKANGNTLIFIKPVKQSLEKTQENYRKNKRWICNSDYLPTGSFFLDSKIMHKTYVKALDISKFGIRFTANKAHLDCAIDDVFDLKIEFPTIGIANLKAKVIHMDNSADDDYKSDFGLKIIKKDKNYDTFIGQYLLQFCENINLEELRKEGIRHKSLAAATRYKTVETIEEYNAVLALRVKAYEYANKLEHSDPMQMKTKYDNWNNIIIGKLNNKVICSILLIFPGEDELLEIEEDMKQRLDDRFESRLEIFETTRVCSDPQYRRSDLIIGLFCESIKMAIENNRKYCVLSADEKITKFYEKIGLRKSGIQFLMERYKDIKHNCLIGDLKNGLFKGKNVNILYWSFVWRPLANFLHKNQPQRFTLIERIHLYLHNALAPLLQQLKK